MFKLCFTIVVVAASLVAAQQPGTVTPEKHPLLPYSQCVKGGTCHQAHGEIVLDAEWRWVHTAKSENCFDGKSWNAAACPDDKTCAQNCMLEGVSNYAETYGITTTGNALKLNFVTHGNVGSRLYLLSNESHYAQFSLTNQEFTFDVDVSSLHCGMNSALYLVTMEADGGTGKHPVNKAGAKYGTGYCDSQCPRGMKFMNGEANPTQKHGACCAEMDLWEANSMAAALTAHPCTSPALTCTGDACPIHDRYAGPCDPDGCGFNSYAMGNHTFYGPGKTVDTSKVFTVVTQFITEGNTATGALHEIRRFYIQGGKVIPNSMSTVSSFHGNSMTTEMCASGASFTKHGGLKKMGEALHAGMTLAFAIWDDHSGGMAWLDSGNNGPCPNNPNNAAELESKYPNSYVTFSNIKVGPINSTFTHA